MPSLLVVCSKFGVFPLLVISLVRTWLVCVALFCFALLLLQFEVVSCFAVCVCCVGYYCLSLLVLWFLLWFLL